MTIATLSILLVLFYWLVSALSEWHYRRQINLALFEVRRLVNTPDSECLDYLMKNNELCRTFSRQGYNVADGDKYIRKAFERVGYTAIFCPDTGEFLGYAEGFNLQSNK